MLLPIDFHCYTLDHITGKELCIELTVLFHTHALGTCNAHKERVLQTLMENVCVMELEHLL